MNQQPEEPSRTSEQPAVFERATLQSEPMGQPQESGQVLEWQASEYVEHEKSVKWFIGLVAAALALAVLAVFLLKNYTFALLIIVMAASVAVWARRPATEMHYKLEPRGIWVNDKLFPLQSFRNFGLLQEGAMYAIVLLPVKRFSPGVTVYFPQELGEQLVDALGTSLPMEEIKPDWIDSITHKLNF